MVADRAFFVAADATHTYDDAIWVTDGTAAGAQELQVAGASFTGLNPDNLAVSLSGTLFFNGFDSSINPNLWVSDGTDAGTHELQVSGAPSNGLSPTDIVAFGNGVAFTSYHSTGLWFSDGTAAGTTRLTVPGTSAGFYVSSLTQFDGKLYFSGGGGIGAGLWVSDGTAAGTQALAVPGASALGLTPRSMASLGTKLVLNGTSASGAEGLWVSDGTAAGTVALSVPGLNPTGHIADGPAGLVAFGNKAAFAAMDATGQDGLWVTDGTDRGHAGTAGRARGQLGCADGCAVRRQARLHRGRCVRRGRGVDHGRHRRRHAGAAPIGCLGELQPGRPHGPGRKGAVRCAGLLRRASPLDVGRHQRRHLHAAAGCGHAAAGRHQHLRRDAWPIAELRLDRHHDGRRLGRDRRCLHRACLLPELADAMVRHRLGEPPSQWRQRFPARRSGQ